MSDAKDLYIVFAADACKL